MLTIRNTTGRPVTIHIFGGKTLHLGPHKVGEVSDQTESMPSFRRLIDAGTIELISSQESSGHRSGEGSVQSEATHGHKPTTVVMPKGNR